ncbi:MBL fold metallo-hydrolase [Pseudonocardia bannensis]|uniref:Uncharacterized protein n=1 Tax=Pseudonocardia bannensis TaxID=630973 RepID=A0A848DJ62_9PSEU|nr:MBL fold metallo-hydrolase [Pseudonocardia bannensis]NMH92579.1 hypothetical protein [Pseudonocardia bannensis]
MPVMPSIGRPSTLLAGGERFTANGREWEILHTPGHSPGPGAPFRDGARRADAIAQGKRRRLRQTRELVETREYPATELELFRSALTGAQRHFAMAEILAYLAFHEVRGVLTRGRRPDGVYLWRPVEHREGEVDR